METQDFELCEVDECDHEQRAAGFCVTHFNEFISRIFSLDEVVKKQWTQAQKPSILTAC